MDAIIAGGQAKAGRVHADGHGPGVVLGAIQHIDFSQAHDGGRVESMERLPVHRFVGDRISEDCLRIGLDDRCIDWPHERPQRPAKPLRLGNG